MTLQQFLSALPVLIVGGHYEGLMLMKKSLIIITLNHKSRSLAVGISKPGGKKSKDIAVVR